LGVIENGVDQFIITLAMIWYFQFSGTPRYITHQAGSTSQLPLSHYIPILCCL
jgi:hypothetical protein